MREFFSLIRNEAFHHHSGISQGWIYFQGLLQTSLKFKHYSRATKILANLTHCTHFLPHPQNSTLWQFCTQCNQVCCTCLSGPYYMMWLTVRIFVHIPRIVFYNSSVYSVAQLGVHVCCNLIGHSHKQVHKVATFPETRKYDYETLCPWLQHRPQKLFIERRSVEFSFSIFIQNATLWPIKLWFMFYSFFYIKNKIQ